MPLHFMGEGDTCEHASRGHGPMENILKEIYASRRQSCH